MQTYTIADIRAFHPKPCYDPGRYLPKNWQGTALDILRIEACPPEDRLWVVFHWLDERTKRLFAVWCARQRLSYLTRPDPRLLKACDVAELYANGRASAVELAEAHVTAAYAYAYTDAHAAAVAAADAYATAAAAAYAAAAAAYAAADATDATADAAAAAARARQVQHLVEMLEAEQPVTYD